MSVLLAHRSRRTSASLAALAFVTAAVMLTACTAPPPEPGGESTADGAINVGFTVAPTTLDPASGCTLDDARLTSALYVQLVQNGVKDGPDDTEEVDPTVVEPYFASSWDVSDDGLTYTFHLNEGWTFPSGEPMDAEAVKYSLERANTIAGCGQAIINDLYTDPLLIQEITAVDDATVEIDLDHPDPDFLLAMATSAASIVDPSLVEANGGVAEALPNEWLTTNEAGSGPYRLTEYEPGTRAVLTRDPDFQGEPGASEVINVNWIQSDSAMQLQIENGTLDIAQGLTKTSAKAIEDKGELKVVTSYATANMQFLMPNDTAPWDNAKLREAVTYAIPYQDILDNVLQGYGQLYYGPIPPTMPGYDDSVAGARTYDLDKAKQLAEESGVELPVTVELDILSSDPTQSSIATILQGALSEIGIDLEVKAMSEAEWGEAVYGLTAPSALRLDGPAIFGAGYYLQYDEVCDSAWNTGRICVEGNSELLAEARGALSEEDRDAALSQLQENWVAESPKVPLYLDGTAVVMASGFQYRWSPTTDMRFWAVG
ncbi:ABC transporter substrate-binding protein [Microbacterium paludicola]|nr:ABC transporter substrate-binding protein [Microbacterium paludicola]MBF0817171.1 ABC transporter substrate-binding protein [Microbacterium paludicola]